MVRFLITFVIVLTLLFSLEMLSAVQVALIEPLTGLLAKIASALILPFDASVIATGRELRDMGNQFAVSIEAGCNGVEALIVLVAGIVAFPATGRQKFTAIILGAVAVQVLNILRIISLFYLGQWNYTLFEWTHLYFWPVLIMLDVLVVFAVYLRWLAGSKTPQPAMA